MNGLVGIIGAGIPMEREVRAMAEFIQHRGVTSDSTAQGIQSWHKALGNGCSIALCYGSERSALFKHEKILLWEGELRNSAQLQKLLATDGMHHDASDVELVLAAWQRWGPHCLEHFIGDYAFVLFDCVRCTLYLARDPLGTRPLFYAFDGEQYSFCSEIKPLIHCTQLGYNADAIVPLLLYGVIADDQTHIAGIRRVLPGHLVTLTRDFELQLQDIHSLRKQCQAPIKNSRRSALSYEEKQNEEKYELLEAELKDVVAYHIKKQPKPHILFNEGLSAGLIAALAHSTTQSVEAVVYVPTTAQGLLAGASAQRDQAHAMAKQLNIPLREIEISINIAEDFPTLLSTAQQPFCRSRALSLHLLNHAMQQVNASSFLSALGANELFSGDEAYRLAYFAARLRALPQKIRTQLRWLDTPWLQRWLHASVTTLSQALSLAELEADHAWQASRGLSGDLLKTLLAAPSGEQAQQKNQAQQQNQESISQDFWQFKSDTVNRWSYLDLFYQVIPGCIPALEQPLAAQEKTIAFPFLDERIIPLALSIPGVEKIESRWWAKPQVNQKTLRHWAADYFSTDCIVRPETIIQFPLRQWLKNELTPWVQDYILSANGLSGRDAFCEKTLKQWVAEHRADQVDHSEILWRLLCLEHSFRC